MPQNLISIFAFLVCVLIVWLGVISFFLYKTIRHYNHLAHGADKKTLTVILESILKTQNVSREHCKDIDVRVTHLERNTKFHFQKVGLLRFNPFADTGGEQSFIVVLLDHEDNGIVLTSLQGRSGVRWYAKQVKKGKGIKFDLSKEEEEAVKKAVPLS